MSWMSYIFFFFNDTATTAIYTLSLHDALPILTPQRQLALPFILLLGIAYVVTGLVGHDPWKPNEARSEEHTSELQSLRHLVCRLLLEKKKNTIDTVDTYSQKHRCNS